MADNFTKTIKVIETLIAKLTLSTEQAEVFGSQVKNLQKDFESLGKGANVLLEIEAILASLTNQIKAFNLSGLLDQGELNRAVAQLNYLKGVARTTAAEMNKVDTRAGPPRGGGLGQGTGGEREGFVSELTGIDYRRVPQLYDSENARQFRSIAGQITRQFEDQLRLAKLADEGWQRAFQERLQRTQSQQRLLAEGAQHRDYGEFLVEGNFYGDATKAQQNLEKALKEYGLGLGNITSIQKDAVSGTAQISAEFTDLSGRTKSLTLAQNRLGEITTRTGGGFRTMAQEVGRSVAQFAKFMVSATLVYGILNLIAEQSEVVIKNQVELANIAVILGRNQEQLAEVYQSAAEAANYASESINGVLKGYQQALRATGNVADEQERFVKANLFLTESLVLSKLSTLDQAKAMDILIAALAQSSIEIEDARGLLDRFVATSKIANVDMRTLAESYAIVATVAGSAGIEVKEANNELVGLIAVLAEQTQLTPTETGNALRAVITGLNTDIAVQQLRSFGIAVTDVNGEMRDFFDITTDIHLAWREGLISDSELSALSRSIGGGTRRQAQVEVILKGLDRAFQINEQSANQYGAAEEALTVRTETLEDALTRLSNAFQELAQVWGTDGGALAVATGLVEMLTDLLDIIEKISKVLGPNTLGIFAAGLVSSLASARNRLPFEGVARGIDQRFGTPIQPNPLLPPTGFQQVGGIPGLGIQGRTPGQWATAGAQFGLGVGIPAAANFLQGNEAQGWGNLIGGTIGTAAGLAFGAPQVGAILGSVAGGALADSIVTIEGDLQQAFEDALTTAVESNKKSLGDIFSGEAEPTEITEDAVFRAIGGGNKVLGQFLNFFQQSNFERGFPALLEGPEAFREQREFVEGSTEAEQIFFRLRNFNPEAFLELARQFPIAEAQTTAEGIPISDYAGTGQRIVKENAALLAQVQEEAIAQLNRNVRTGAVSQREVSQRRLDIEGVSSAVSFTIPGILEDGMVQIGEDFFELSEAVAILSDVFIYGGAEELDNINKASAALAKLANQIEDATKAGELETRETQDAITQYELLQEELAQQIQLTRISNAVKKEEIPAVQELPGEFLPGGESALAERIREIETAYQDAALPDELARTGYQGALPEDFLLRLGDTYQRTSQIPGLEDFKFSSETLSRAIAELSEAGGIFAGGAGGNPQIINFNFLPGSPQADAVLGSGYTAQTAELGELGYSEDIAPIIAVYANKQMELIHRDNTIIQMLLQGIEENTSDMIDGIYNLPSDGTFFVPFAGYEFGASNVGGGGGGGFGGYEAIGGEIGESIKSKVSEIPEVGGSAQRYIQEALGMAEDFKDYSDMFREVTPRTSPDDVGPATGTFSPTAIEAWQRWLDQGGWQIPEPEEPISSTLPPVEGLADPLGFFDFSSLGDSIGQTLSQTLDDTPIRLNIDITSTFETTLDGEVIGIAVKRYLTEEMVRKGDATTGGNTTSVII